MAVLKPIRTEYPDGMVTITNVRSKLDGSTISYTVVDKWYDDTAMSDAKIDEFGIFTKYKMTSEYLRQNLPNWGDNFLEINTVAEFRTLSAYNLALLNFGYYKGIRLNGYYTRGDTPSSIDYFISSTSASDDGGSVIVISGVKFEHDFKGVVNSIYFGINQSNSSNAVNFFKFISNKENLRVFLSKTSISNTYDINNSSNLELSIESLSISGYRGLNVTNCPKLYVSGNIDGGSTSVVGLTIKDSKGVNCWVNVYNLGNNTVNQVRGIEFVGDCSDSTYVGEIDNLVSSSVASGVSFNTYEDRYSQNTTVNNSKFSNIYPIADSDGVKYLQLGKNNNSLVSNCVFVNTSKRGVKLQGLNNKVENCHFEGQIDTACIDAQDGSAIVKNCTSLLTGNNYSMVYAQNGGVEVIDCDFKGDATSISTASSGVRIEQANWTESYKLNKITVTNSSFSNTAYPIRFVNNVYHPNYDIDFNNVRGVSFTQPYMIALDGCNFYNLSVINTSAVSTPSTYYGILGGFLSSQTIQNANIHSNIGKVIDGALANQRDNPNLYIEFSTEPINRVKVVQNGNRRDIFTDVSSIDDSRLTTYLYQSRIGDLLWINPTSGVSYYVCTVAGNGISSIGTWQAQYVFKKSTNVANVSIVDATDLATAIALVNDLKAKLNAKLTADRNSGQQSNI